MLVLFVSFQTHLYIYKHIDIGICIHICTYMYICVYMFSDKFFCPLLHSYEHNIHSSVSRLFFWLHCAVGGILVPPSEMEPVPLGVEAQSPNCWTTKEVPRHFFPIQQYDLAMTAHQYTNIYLILYNTCAASVVKINLNLVD